MYAGGGSLGFLRGRIGAAGFLCLASCAFMLFTGGMFIWSGRQDAALAAAELESLRDRAYDLQAQLFSLEPVAVSVEDVVIGIQSAYAAVDEVAHLQDGYGSVSAVDDPVGFEDIYQGMARYMQDKGLAGMWYPVSSDAVPHSWTGCVSGEFSSGSVPVTFTCMSDEGRLLAWAGGNYVLDDGMFTGMVVHLTREGQFAAYGMTDGDAAFGDGGHFDVADLMELAGDIVLPGVLDGGGE